MISLQPWVKAIFADPVTKLTCSPDSFPAFRGVIDARVFLKNTHGYSSWAEGQSEYESSALQTGASVETYRREIECDRPVYVHFPMDGRVLDSGGGAGTVREFLSPDSEFVATDPWLQAPFASSQARRDAYACLNRPLNFIGATAEFLPFLPDSFDWVHMRSMLDHVQVPDLALLEAKRVLRMGGHILVGLYVEGGKAGRVEVKQRVKDKVKAILGGLGIDRWIDHHVWHPTFESLTKLVRDNGFEIVDTYWQPQWQDTVCYVCARKVS